MADGTNPIEKEYFRTWNQSCLKWKGLNMDIPRKGAARSRLIRRIIVSVVVIGALGGITFVVKGMKPAAQSVERSTVWPDTVKRGEMIRNVRGLGTLVPEDIV